MLTAKELKERDPQRFESEYWKWSENAAHDDWWEGVYEGFQLDNDPKGVHIDLSKTYFSLGYCQSDHAQIGGYIDFAEWMQAHGYDTKYLALYLDAKDYGANADIGRSWVSLEYIPGNVAPRGVFSDLPEEAWDEMVTEQRDAEDWEDLMYETVKDLNNELYTQLVQEYEYLTSEDMFVEDCEANDVLFEVEE